MDFVHRSDGSSLIIAESRWMNAVTTCTTTKYGTSCTTTYYYNRNNIFIISLSAKGEVLAFYDIPKRQLSTNDGGLYSSYLLIQKGDRIFFVYNDNPKNMDTTKTTIRDVKLFNSPKSGILVAVELLPDGKYSKQQLLVNKERKMATRPEAGFMVDKGVYIAPITSYPRSKMLGFIRFDVK